MRPEHLKSPFTWKERHITIHDHILYVPGNYSDFASFQFPGWNDPSIFVKEQPICIEYCTGNGAWIAAKALQYPQKNWVAVELKFERVRKVWSKLKNYSFDNLFIVCGEGQSVTSNYIPSNSVHEVYINFPDPWPKTRHAKHRIIQKKFIDEIARILLPGGTLTLATDDAPYSQMMTDVMLQVPLFQSLHPHPFYLTEYPGYGTSFFEDLWREQGKNIHYHIYQKNNHG